jgi:hypothetical protein
MKARIQQAIWQPQDAYEIAISATPVKAGTSFKLTLKITAADLALRQQDNFWTDKLDIFLIERDDASRHANISGQRLGLHLKPETYQRVLREGIEFEEPVETKQQGNFARVLVVDENSGRMGSVTIPGEALNR